MSVTRLLPACFKTCLINGFLLIQTLGFCFAEGPELIQEKDRGLIRVIAKMESGTLIYNDQIVSQSRVVEVNEFPGVYIDARGYVAAYLGNHWLKYASKNSRADFYLTWNSEKKAKAELVGIDERVSIAVLKAENYQQNPAILGNKLELGKMNLSIWKGGQLITIPLKVIDLVGANAVPEREIRAIEFKKPSYLENYPSGSYVTDNPGRFLGFVTRINQHGVGRSVKSYLVIPSEVVNKSFQQVLKAGGNITPGWLGITPEDSSEKEVRVKEVRRDSPAEKIGLKSGDLILAVNDYVVDSLQDFSKIIRWNGPDTTINLKIDRSGEIVRFSPTLAKWPVENQVALAWKVEIPKVPTNTESQPELEMKITKIPLPPYARLGFDLYQLTPKLAKAWKVPSEIGLLVEDVKEGSIANLNGFLAGDILLEANHIKLKSVADFKDVLDATDEVLVLHFLRDGKVFIKKFPIR
jgi:serine protease Do